MSTLVSYEDMATKFYEFFAGAAAARNLFYQKVIANAPSTSSENVVQSFRMLQDCLKQRCFNWPVTSCPILISIDEVHVLFNLRQQDADASYNLYSRLKSVLSEAVSESFCTIFLSTATNISQLAPTKDVAPSMRERDDERLLPAPFTEFPFDVHVIAHPLVPGQATLDTVGSLEFTSKFGRPLCVDLT